MKNWRRVIAFDVVMALLIILLYFPAGLGLSPFDPNFLNAALSVIGAVLIAYETIKVNARAILTARAAKMLSEGTEDMTVEDLKRVLGFLYLNDIQFGCDQFFKVGLKPVSAVPEGVQFLLFLPLFGRGDRKFILRLGLKLLFYIKDVLHPVAESCHNMLIGVTTEGGGTLTTPRAPIQQG